MESVDRPPWAKSSQHAGGAQTRPQVRPRFSARPRRDGTQSRQRREFRVLARKDLRGLTNLGSLHHYGTILSITGKPENICSARFDKNGILCYSAHNRTLVLRRGIARHLAQNPEWSPRTVLTTTGGEHRFLLHPAHL